MTGTPPSAACASRLVLDSTFTASCSKDAGHCGPHADPAYRMDWTDPKIAVKK